ncbi:MAG: hypothetical protein D0528_03725 [Methylococcales bacterium]|nr:MAG: hypothetical protein D0528_03725 [Methylococcales bacterium]
MARIKFIVTGDMEKSALHKSLQRFFPNIRDSDEVIWDTPRKAQCVTSYPLQPLTSGNLPSKPMIELAKAMFAETFSSKTGHPADLVIVVDDVELGNLNQEAVIAEHFRAAVNTVFSLENYDLKTEERRRKQIQQKCSFHLLKPMVEAYLFGDSASLALAGVQNGVNTCLVHPSDVEQFESNDSLWLTICHAENTKKQQNKPWWRNELHPKRYLEHLTERGQVTYEETKGGKDALIALDWSVVPKCQLDIPIIRSLFEDISEWFGIESPIIGDTHPGFYPATSVNRANLLLRNM